MSYYTTLEYNTKNTINGGTMLCDAFEMRLKGLGRVSSSAA